MTPEDYDKAIWIVSGRRKMAPDALFDIILIQPPLPSIGNQWHIRDQAVFNMGIEAAITALNEAKKQDAR